MGLQCEKLCQMASVFLSVRAIFAYCMTYPIQPEEAPNSQHRLAIFASGAGSNAATIVCYFKNHPTISVALIVCNKTGAGVLEIAKRNDVPVLEIERERFFSGDAYLPVLLEHKISFIVLAGFLWKIPSALVTAFPGKIVNIHPALLPNYGGKGMYGTYVHAAVLKAGDTQSGITIHLVDEQYDNGAILFQAACPVFHTDTPDSLAKRVHELEHQHYAPTLEGLLLNK